MIVAILLFNKKFKKKKNLLYIYNATHSLEFCDNIRGIHGACPAEVLHVLQHGIFNYAVNQFMDLKKMLKNPSIYNITDTNNIIDIGNVESTNKFFVGENGTEFEKICSIYGELLQHQSDRNLPRTKIFSNYLTEKKKTGQEMSGLLLVYVVVLASEYGNNIEQFIGEKNRYNFLYCFEILLCIENLCKIESHNKDELNIINFNLKYILIQIRDILNRTNGVGMKIVKFHLISHFISDIIRFGSMSNYDSSIGERNHISDCKQPANRTQRRKTNFEYQTSNHYVDNLCINRAYSYIQNGLLQYNLDSTVIYNKDVPIVDNKNSKYQYDFEIKQILKKNKITKKFTDTINWDDTHFVSILKNFCDELILNKYITGPINFFTQHNRTINDTKYIFRADPSYHTKKSWHDWINIKWEDQNGQISILPAKLMLFIDLNNILVESFSIKSINVPKKDIYAIIFSSTTDSISKINNNNIKLKNINNNKKKKNSIIESNILYKIKLDIEQSNKFGKNLPKLYLIPVDSIHSACIAIPYSTKEKYMYSNDWLIVKPKIEWLNSLIEHCNKFNI